MIPNQTKGERWRFPGQSHTKKKFSFVQAGTGSPLNENPVEVVGNVAVAPSDDALDAKEAPPDLAFPALRAVVVPAVSSAGR